MVKVGGIDNLPHSPGVYLFKDRDEVVIYVGKAKDIKKRVFQYFRTKNLSPKTNLLVSKINSIDFICTSSEKEAFILEFNLIKKYRPKYNIVLRDDKSYLLFKLDLNHPFPRVQITRKFVSKPQCKYFGPYTSAKAARETYKLINKIFPIRKCKDTIFKNRTRPCLQFHIKRCLAPCCFDVKREYYLEIIKEVQLFLKGRNKELISKLEKEMWNASDNLEFERAASIRDRIREIKKTLEQQRVLILMREDMDVFALEQEEAHLGVGVLMLRGGRVVGEKDFVFNGDTINFNEIGGPKERFSDVLSSIIYQFYSTQPYIPDKILIPSKGIDPHVVDLLEEKKGKKVHIIFPSTSKLKDLIRLASINIFKEKNSKYTMELIAISKLLNMPSVPRRIEVIDASHIMGKHTMVGMVVFENGELKKDKYRIYRFEELDDKRDDYLTLLSWTERRFKSGLPWPDVLIIDGGRGQLNTVRYGFKELFGSTIPFKMISIAKTKGRDRGDKIYIAGRKNPIILPRDSKELLFIQFLRDNVHRYIVSRTRKRAESTSLKSLIQSINGVGPKTYRLMWGYFGSLDRILSASPMELKNVPGIGKKRAEEIYLGLQKIKEEVNINNI